VGLRDPALLTGPELRRIPGDQLARRVRWVQAFAEVEPDQKEELITALRAGGDVVGYIGDGINDAPAIHAADVGISVESAVDVSKEAADIVLLETDLAVLAEGVREGRRTFANTMKYVYMATSANFGNMFSMAGASLFMPFLPLLPEQILLANLLTDFPEMTIAADRTDPEMVEAPRRWDIHFIRRFMLNFGLLSSVFDYLTFGVLLLLLRAPVTHFRAGWFVESVVSAALIVLVIRSRRPFYRSRPSRLLAVTTVLVVCVAIALPYSPLAGLLGFAPLPGIFLAALAVIVVLYVAGAELLKRHFYRRAGFGRESPVEPGRGPEGR
jgi:Mg2+-importing ATPase